MVQAQLKPLSFDDYLTSYPEDGGIYELINGELIEVNPTGEHEEVIAALVSKLNLEIHRLGLSLFMPRTCTIKPHAPFMGYKPDLVVLDRVQLDNEPLWKKASTITQGSSAPLVMEVVSSNWGDDYGHKLTDYEAMGIQEYWIVDYLGLGGRRHIGNPKQPTLSICQLLDGEYQITLLRNKQKIHSTVFPELDLTAQQVMEVSQ